MSEERKYGREEWTLLELNELGETEQDLVAHLRELLAEIEDYKGDALRFRWDQQCSHFFYSEVLYALECRKIDGDWPTLDECRAAYDAAIEASEGCMDA